MLIRILDVYELGVFTACGHEFCEPLKFVIMPVAGTNIFFPFFFR